MGWVLGQNNTWKKYTTISFKRLHKKQVLSKLQFFMESYVGKEGQKRRLVFAQLRQTRQTGLCQCT